MTTHVDPAPVLDLIEGFRRSKTMFTAVRLGLFDELVNGSQSPDALARKLDLNPRALKRLMDGCVALGLLDYDPATLSYSNSLCAAKYLCAASPDALTGYIGYSDESLYPLWGHLDDAVREGSNRWTQTFGRRDALFAHFFRDDAAADKFLGGMHGFGRLSSPRVVRAFDLARFTRLCDLGGATGHLAIAACEAYPNLHATVFDLPSVARFTPARISHSAAADRISFHSGDFFTDPLPPADLYALGRILHDWDDSHIAGLLEKISAALPPGGALLVAETLVDEDRCGPIYSLMQDLNMLICTEGRERTFLEYRTLLEAAGFSEVDCLRTGSLLDAVFAVRL